MINPQWLELPLSRTNFHGPKDARAIEFRLYSILYMTKVTNLIHFYSLSSYIVICHYSLVVRLLHSRMRAVCGRAFGVGKGRVVMKTRKPIFSFIDGFIYSRISVARTSLGPWKFVRDMGSSSHWGLIIAQGQKANKNNLGMSFPSSKD